MQLQLYDNRPSRVDLHSAVDADNLQRLLEFLLTHESIRKAAASNAQARAAEHYGWDHVADQLADICSSVLKRDQEITASNLKAAA